MEEENTDAWVNPQWYLLSYKKSVRASSYEKGKEPELAVDEDATTWWQSQTKDGWLQLDLGKVYDVRAVQINFADDKIDIPVPGEIKGTKTQPRYIEEKDYVTRWKLEGSMDGITYEVLEDKSGAVTDLPHDFIVKEQGIKVRYIKLTIYEFHISRNRVFPVCVYLEQEMEKNRKMQSLQ